MVMNVLLFPVQLLVVYLKQKLEFSIEIFYDLLQLFFSWTFITT